MLQLPQYRSSDNRARADMHNLAAPFEAGPNLPIKLGQAPPGGWTWSATSSHRLGALWLGSCAGVGLSWVFAASEARAHKSP